MKNTSFLKAVAITAIATFLFSCNSGKSGKGSMIIDVEKAVGKGSVEKLSDYVKDIRYIPLETTDSSLLGDISDICFENGLIYVSDRNDCCKIFDESGKFIRSIKHIGRGPEEYIGLLDISINTDNGNIMALSINGEVVEYTKDGIFVRKIPKAFKKGGPYSFIPLNKRIFCINCFVYNKDKNPESISYIFDDSLNVLNSFSSTSGTCKKSSVSSAVAVIYIDPFDTYKFGDEFFVTQGSNDTIYKIAENFKLAPRYIVNLGKYKDESVRNMLPQETNDLSVITKYPVMYETNDFLFMKFDLHALAPESFDREHNIKIPGINPVEKNTQACGIYDKKREKFIFLKQPIKGKLGLMDDIKYGPVFWPCYSTSRGELITYFDAVDLISIAENEGGTYKGISEIVGNLHENDNPVIVIAR